MKSEKDLFYKKTVGWDKIDLNEYDKIMAFSEKYKSFLNSCKNERECVDYIHKVAVENGFIDIKDIAKSKTKNKLYIEYAGTFCALVVINDFEGLGDGFAMVGAHIDTPRLDLKPYPLYEADDMLYMKTHYYGGIKKYQWVATPLSMHGVIVKTNMEKVHIVIGEDLQDPVFTINDLLPHLSKEQNKKTADKAIEGEQLNILVGSIPFKFSKKDDSIKLNILKLLNERYGIHEEDFISAELQLVPAGIARDVGFDKSFVGSHGQDDRVCAYAGLKALIDAKTVKKNIVMIFFDKEEIGSMGKNGAQSNILERVVSDIYRVYGKLGHSAVINALRNTKFISADVTVGYDPDWKEVSDIKNSAKMGFGVCISKYTGHGGKFGSNEASAEYLADIRRIYNKNNVVWQTGEIGKVDQGGGGTIAYHIAKYGADVIDCGTPLLSMHSTFEVASKFDIYQTYKSYKIFYEDICL